MATRSARARKREQNKKKLSEDTSDEDYNEASDASSSGVTVPSSSDESDGSDDDSSYSEEEEPTPPIKSGKQSKQKRTRSRPKEQTPDSNEDPHSDHDDAATDFLHRHNDEELLPEPVVYLQAVSDSVIKPDPRLFDIVNDEIYINGEDADDHEINAYLKVMSDEKTRRHFAPNQEGLLTAEQVESVYLQREAMTEVMHEIDETIESLISNHDHTIFNEIVQFIQDTYRKHSDADSANKTAMEYLWMLNQHIVPTAMLMCGQNVSDHPLHFEHLQHQLQSQVTPLLVRITQDDLKKTGSFGNKTYDIQRFIVHSLFENLTNWQVSKRPHKTQSKKLRKCRSDAENMHDDKLYFNMKQELHLPTLESTQNEVLRTFMMWYFKHSKCVLKFCKHNTQHIESCFDGLPKIVIMLDCIEQWSPHLLSSLIYTLHDMKDGVNGCHIPFVLVLGVSTTEDLLGRMVEGDALRLLSVSRYYFKPSFDLYQELAEQILIETSPILFDSCILNKLLNHYQLNDYSVARFKDQIRYLFMSYFMNTKASQYAAYLMHLQRKTNVGAHDDTNDDGEAFDQLWFDEQEEYIEGLLQSTPYNQGEAHEEFQRYLDEEVFKVYQRYREALKVFKMITDHLQFQWSRTEIIAKLQDKTLLCKYLLSRVGADDKNIKISAEERAQFPARIENFKHCHYIYKILHEKTKRFDEEFSDLAAAEYANITEQLENKQKAPQTQMSVSNDNAANKRGNANKSKLMRSQLKRQLTAQTNKNLYDDSRNTLFGLLRTFIEKHLKPMHQLPLHELFVYKNESEFCEHMFPPTNRMMRKRWQNAHQFYGVNAEEMQPEPMSAIYDVYESCEFYINLHDAYIAFKDRMAMYDEEDRQEAEQKERAKSRRNEKRKQRKTKKKKRKNAKSKHSKTEMSEDEEDEEGEHEEKKEISEREKMNHIQFRMGMDDLRFCGYVKATNRMKQALVKTAECL